MEYGVFEYVQNIRQNHKLRHEYYEKLVGGNDYEKSDPSSGKNLKRLLPGKLALDTAICYRKDTIQSSAVEL